MIIELGKFKKGMEELLDKMHHWCYLLKNSDKMEKKEQQQLVSKGGDEMAKAVKRLWNLSQSEWARVRYNAELKRDMDIRTDREVHYEKGMEKGIEKTALAMLEEGFDETVISKITKLPKKGINALKRMLEREK